jgi:biotin carboxyl carrier protein
MRSFTLNIIGKSYEIQIERVDSSKFDVFIDGKKYETRIEDDSEDAILISVEGGLFTIGLEGESETGKISAIVNSRDRIILSEDLFGSKGISNSRKDACLDIKSPVSTDGAHTTSKTTTSANGILAPMPGKVIAVKVNCQDEVKVGDVVVILEAMKMENEITSQREGKISEVRVKEGDSVDADEVLVVVS